MVVLGAVGCGMRRRVGVEETYAFSEGFFVAESVYLRIPIVREDRKSDGKGGAYPEDASIGLSLWDMLLGVFVHKQDMLCQRLHRTVRR